MNVSGTMLSRHRYLLSALLLAAACLLTFFASLDNAFMMDDYGMILQESRGHNPGRLLDEFIPDFRRLQGVQDMPGNVYYRPWAQIIPLGCYTFFHDHPLGYHVVNLLLFWLAALSVYGFIRYAFADDRLAIVASLVFVVHPINGLMVNYITASVFSVQIIAMLLGMIAGMKASEGRHSGWWTALGLLAFVNALFCHETALAFPFYLFVCLIIIKRLNIKKAVGFSWPFWLTAGLYLIIRMLVISLKANVLDKIPDINLLEYLASFSVLAAWYFKCLLTLKGIVIIWSTEIIRQGVWPWIAGLILVVSAAGAAIVRLWKSKHVLWLLWIVISFLPVTLACFFQPRLGLMIEPHWLLIGTIGFLSGICALLLHLAAYFRWGVLVVISAVVIACVLESWSYNQLWGSEQKYCEYWHRQTPRMKSVLFYLAGTYEQQGDWLKARDIYLQSIDGNSSDFEAYNNIGLMYSKMGDKRTAGEYFAKALEIHPQSSVTMANWGAILFDQGVLDQAEERLQTALQLNPLLLEPRLTLAEILKKQGRASETLQLYQKNDQIDPTSVDNLEAWLKTLLSLKDQADVPEIAGRLLKVCDDPQRLTSVAAQLAMHNQIEWAGFFFDHVLSRYPDHPEAYLEAGKFLGNLNQLDEAIRLWEIGLGKFPRDPRFSDLIRQARDVREKIPLNS